MWRSQSCIFNYLWLGSADLQPTTHPFDGLLPPLLTPILALRYWYSHAAIYMMQIILQGIIDSEERRLDGSVEEFEENTWSFSVKERQESYSRAQV